MSIKRAADGFYALKFLNLLKKPFNNWAAFELGILDGAGYLLKRPKTSKEKESYTRFHALVRAIKQSLEALPGSVTRAATLYMAYKTLREEHLSESDHDMIANELPQLNEAMVAGDFGGDPKRIAAGDASGNFVHGAPQVLGTKKKKPKKLKQFREENIKHGSHTDDEKADKIKSVNHTNKTKSK